MQIEIEQDPHYGEVFALLRLSSGTYVCPGWHRVPEGTTREQIVMLPIVNKAPSASVLEKPKKAAAINKSWKVAGSKPGTVYDVTNKNGKWSCSCPSASFHRGDCKHVKKLKLEEYAEQV
jgi:hypothetical protein